MAKKIIAVKDPRLVQEDKFCRIPEDAFEPAHQEKVEDPKPKGAPAVEEPKKVEKKVEDPKLFDKGKK